MRPRLIDIVAQCPFQDIYKGTRSTVLYYSKQQCLTVSNKLIQSFNRVPRPTSQNFQVQPEVQFNLQKEMSLAVQ